MKILGFGKNKEVPVVRSPPRQPKKGKCIIKFKKTAQGEQIEFTDSCKPEQLEYARRMREEKGYS